MCTLRKKNALEAIYSSTNHELDKQGLLSEYNHTLHKLYKPLANNFFANTWFL